jgi:molybdopterin-guanine dinucleotide biosynthesis protein A
MRRPKAPLPFGNATILDRLIAELSPAFAELIVVAAPAEVESAAMGEILAPWEGRICLIRDQEAFAGPVAAVIRGLRAAQHPIVFVCSCDLPLLRASVALKLCAMVGEFDTAIPEIDGKSQPLCAAYRPGAADLIETIAMTGESRLTAITARLRVRRIEAAELRLIDPELHSFVNVNTPEDYTRALAIAGFRQKNTG